MLQDVSQGPWYQLLSLMDEDNSLVTGATKSCQNELQLTLCAWLVWQHHRHGQDRPRDNSGCDCTRNSYHKPWDYQFQQHQNPWCGQHWTRPEHNAAVLWHHYCDWVGCSYGKRVLLNISLLRLQGVLGLIWVKYFICIPLQACLELLRTDRSWDPFLFKVFIQQPSISAVSLRSSPIGMLSRPRGSPV